MMESPDACLLLQGGETLSWDKVVNIGTVILVDQAPEDIWFVYQMYLSK